MKTCTTLKRFIWLTSATALIGLFQGCSRDQAKVNSNLPTKQSLEQVANSNSKLSSQSSIKYFGFFADGMAGVGTGNYISETSKVPNINFISSENISGLGSKIEAAAKGGNKVVIIAEAYLFNWQTVELQSNFKTNLYTLKNYLDTNGYADNVAGFYMVDEPYFKNVTAKSPLSEQQVYNNLQEAAAQMNQIFGSKIIMVTEAYPTFDKYLETGKWLGFPPEYNWIAVNCYLVYGSICDTDEKYTKYVTALNSKLVANQQIILTLDNYLNSVPGANAGPENKLIARTKLQIALAQKFNSPALISFLYQSQINENESLVGLNNLPNLKDYIFKLATTITGKVDSGGMTLPISPIAAITTPPQSDNCVNLEPACEGHDSVRRNSCGVVVETWKNAPICPSTPAPAPAPAPANNCVNLEPACEGHDSVRRNSCGGVVETWKNAPICPATSAPAPAPAPANNCVNLEPACEGH
ncbi:MAG: hypothetical protein H7061_07425, partial [Bdellovibrionaceae bacterium]|nr:hypothetical protein [Bdellovibrio sp.]